MTNFTIEGYVQSEKTSKAGNTRKEWVFIGHTEMPDLTVVTEWKVKKGFLHTVEFGRNCRYNLNCVWNEKTYEEIVEEAGGPEIPEVIYKAYLKAPREGMSMASDSLVTIIGEQAVEWEDGDTAEQYIYLFKGEEDRGEFIARKCNIIEL